ncbi:MAG: hypothetical protein RBG13Loki_0910 [Promethearchaeota archaeon CR_4]|nr:MAG: hypothetical protein RBG13Loki_0910 [Candidatus Lokiarchaeota archaeon CR_4]
MEKGLFLKFSQEWKKDNNDEKIRKREKKIKGIIEIYLRGRCRARLASINTANLTTVRSKVTGTQGIPSPLGGYKSRK